MSMRFRCGASVTSAFILAAGAVYAQGGPPDPTVTVDGQQYTPLSIVTRNMDHPAQFGMDATYAVMQTSKTTPFIDARTCGHETDIQEAMFKAILAEQQKR